jgi:hypothetical protein
MISLKYVFIKNVIINNELLQTALITAGCQPKNIQLLLIVSRNTLCRIIHYFVALSKYCKKNSNKVIKKKLCKHFFLEM